MASRFDYPDPAEDETYTNGLGHYHGIERHCGICERVVYVDRDGDFLIRVLCSSCDETDAQRVARERAK